MLISPGYATRGDTNRDANLGDRIGSANLRNAGFNVVTWDPREFGGSGGTTMFGSAAFEGRDVQALVDYVAKAARGAARRAGRPARADVRSELRRRDPVRGCPIEPRLTAIVTDIAWHFARHERGA